jgi:lysine biosynthesis protein LysW
MATCPECDAEVDIDDDDLEEMEIGDPWDCAACGSRLRVASLDPVEFESDDDDDDDDEEGESEEESDEEEFEDDLDEDDDGDTEDWEE